MHTHINLYYSAKGNTKRIARFNGGTHSQKRLKSLPGFNSARSGFEYDDPLSRSMCPSTRVNAFPFDKTPQQDVQKKLFPLNKNLQIKLVSAHAPLGKEKWMT